MEKVKLKDLKTGAVIEVAKEIASDFIGTKRYMSYDEKKEIKRKNFDLSKSKYEEE